MWCRTSLAFSSCCLMLFALSGCIGFAVEYPVECGVDLPINRSYDVTSDSWVSWGEKESERYKDLYFLSEKDDFLNKWGQPDEVVRLSEDEEILVYKSDVWCGVMPAWGVAVPLVLPVCEGFDRVKFKDGRAVHVDFRKEGGSGFMFPVGTRHPNLCPPKKKFD